MRVYLQYPLYKEWNIGRHEYKTGEWKLESKDEILTADIITTIGQAVRKISKEPIPDKLGKKKIKGVHIVKAITDNPNYIICNGAGQGKRYQLKLCEEIEIAEVKAFALVVYWIGNMMPVPKNPSTGRGGEKDTWNYKMKYLLDILYDNENTNHQWDDWRSQWSDKTGNKAEEFIKGNYLQDMFIYDGKEYKVKNDENENWYINNTKLIIQRSYRIVYGYDGEWNEESFKPVNIIMRDVFKIAGISDDLAKNYSESPF